MQGWIKQKKLMQTTTEHTIEWKQKKHKKKSCGAWRYVTQMNSMQMKFCGSRNVSAQ